jgi:hypothetical protein
MKSALESRCCQVTLLFSPTHDEFLDVLTNNTDALIQQGHSVAPFLYRTHPDWIPLGIWTCSTEWVTCQDIEQAAQNRQVPLDLVYLYGCRTSALVRRFHAEWGYGEPDYSNLTIGAEHLRAMANSTANPQGAPSGHNIQKFDCCKEDPQN